MSTKKNIIKKCPRNIHHTFLVKTVYFKNSWVWNILTKITKGSNFYVRWYVISLKQLKNFVKLRVKWRRLNNRSSLLYQVMKGPNVTYTSASDTSTTWSSGLMTLKQKKRLSYNECASKNQSVPSYQLNYNIKRIQGREFDSKRQIITSPTRKNLNQFCSRKTTYKLQTTIISAVYSYWFPRS